MKTQFNFDEIIANIPKVMENRERVRKELEAAKLPLPVDYYEKI